MRPCADDASLHNETEWVLVEKQEHFERNEAGKVVRAKLCVRYWSLNDDVEHSDQPNGEFPAMYDREENGVSLSSFSLWGGGYIVIEPARLQGRGLGTYLMNEVITWVKQWPEAYVRQIELPKGEGPDTPAQRSRIRFYGQFGLGFDFPNVTPVVGVARPMLVRELAPAPMLADGITRQSVIELARARIGNARQIGWEINSLSRNLESERRTLNEAYRHPIIWALKRVVLDEPGRTALFSLFTCVSILALYRLFQWVLPTLQR